MTSRAQPHPVRARRVYEPPAQDDGARVLVDRLWPRGLKRESLALEDWPRELAPSTDLRRWYAHRPERFEEFAIRYRAELEQPEPAAQLAHLRRLLKDRPVTLLTASRDLEHSDAAVLAAVLRGDS